MFPPTLAHDHGLTATPSDVPPPPVVAQDSHPRFSLRPAAEDRLVNSMGGAWWPRSLDLAGELPALLAAVASSDSHYQRVSYSIGFWGEAPRRITTPSGTVKLGGFRFQSASLISLLDTNMRTRLDLLVIPPDTDPDEAGRTLDDAGRSELPAARL